MLLGSALFRAVSGFLLSRGVARESAAVLADAERSCSFLTAGRDPDSGGDAETVAPDFLFM